MKFGPWEIGLILIIILIVFGVGKLPDIGRQLGKGIRDFKKFSSGTEDEDAKAASNGQELKTAPELEVAKAKLEAAEAKLKLVEDPAKKT
ncbi:MAG: twin-arginine translocase TatA/TatE family subunit [Dehalococcoidales bacterium]|nr:twin-arginine translocase TatA/TatE family subunit [Dehalococcoidales bacterium]